MQNQQKQTNRKQTNQTYKQRKIPNQPIETRATTKTQNNNNNTEQQNHNTTTKKTHN